MPDDTDDRELEQTSQEDLSSEDDLDQSLQTPQDQVDDQEDEFPEDPNEQRKAFIQMRQEIKNLKQPRSQQVVQDQPEADEDFDTPVLDNLRYGGGFAPNQNPISPDMDLDAMTSRMTAAEKAAFEARQEVERMRAEREDEQAFMEFPELKNDKKLLKRVKREYGYLKYMEGKPVRVVDVAREIIRESRTQSSSLEQQSLQRSEDIARRKEAASLEARGSSVNQERPNTRLEELKAAAARGDDKARIELLKEKHLTDW